MSAIHIKTIKGREYAYEVTSFWDKEQKKNRKRTVYIGRVVDKEKGVYEKKKKVVEDDFGKSLILNFGDTFCINEHLKQSEYYKIFKDILPEHTDTLMSLICNKLLKSSAMQYAQTWYEGNYASILHKNANMSSQRISDFLKLLGSEKVQRKFFKAYIEKTYNGKSGVIVDSTGLPNEIDFPLSQWGHHGGESEQETRLLMVVDRSNNMPLYFRYMAGNIVDVSTLSGTIAELKQMGVDTKFALVDAGYYSEDNIVDLYGENISFLTRLPSNRSLYKNLIAEHVDALEVAENLVTYGKRALFVKCVPVNLFGNNGYAYIISDVKRKADEVTKYLIAAKEDKLSNEEIDNALKSKGKLILISSEKIDTDEIIPLYYTRQSVENIFGISKSFLDILPLRVHSVEAFRGYLMLNFLSLVVYLGLQKILKDKFTVEGALLQMTNLMCKVYPDKLLVAEPNKNMKAICELLNIMVPNSMGV